MKRKLPQLLPLEYRDKARIVEELRRVYFEKLEDNASDSKADDDDVAMVTSDVSFSSSQRTMEDDDSHSGNKENLIPADEKGQTRRSLLKLSIVIESPLPAPDPQHKVLSPIKKKYHRTAATFSFANNELNSLSENRPNAIDHGF